MKAVAWIAALALGLACSADSAPSGSPPPARTPPARTPPAATTPSIPGPTETSVPPPVPSFDVARALATARVLVERVGPREATTPAFRRAAGYVAARLRGWGYSVRSEPVPVDAGRSSTGDPVPRGTTRNVIASPPGTDTRRPHLVVGAHLDTVPRTPGANDNASGVAVLLELARLASLRRPALPVVWVAFGGEERRGTGPRDRFYGSRAYVAAMSRAERRALRGMVAIDMVGAGRRVLVCRTGHRPDTLVRRFLDTAAKLGIPAARCVEGRPLSDHGPFEDAGLLAAWLWAGNHPTLHRPSDTMSVLQPAELRRVGRLAWETLRRLRG